MRRWAIIHVAMASIVYFRTLQKAADLLGGRKNLARHLRVPIGELENWMSGSQVPPIGVFLKAVDLVLDETGAPRDTDAGEAPPPQDCAAGSAPTLM
jgi:hypothetical protein